MLRRPLAARRCRGACGAEAAGCGGGGALGAGERAEREGRRERLSQVVGGSFSRARACAARGGGCGLRRAPSEPARAPLSSEPIPLLAARSLSSQPPGRPAPHSPLRSSQPTPLIRFREIHPYCPLQVQKLTFRWKLRLPINSFEFNGIFVEASTVSTTLP